MSAADDAKWLDAWQSKATRRAVKEREREAEEHVDPADLYEDVERVRHQFELAMVPTGDADRFTRECRKLLAKGKSPDEVARIMRKNIGLPRQLPQDPEARDRAVTRVMKQAIKRLTMLKKRNARTYASYKKAAATRKRNGTDKRKHDKVTGRFTR